MIARPVEVRVDELLLVGFPPVQRHRIGEAAQRELGRLVTASDATWPAAGGDLAVLTAGSFRLRPGASPEAAGREIGRAVYRRLSG
jgi:hypothetical protein